MRHLAFAERALASIAAVSMVYIATKAKNADMGCETNLEGGKVLSTRAAGLPNGTTITVKNLFFNTPARLKFLKSTAQETAAVTDNVTRLILSHPDISFKYICNGETVFTSPGSGDLKDALFCVYGRDLVHKIVKVDYTYEDIHVYGYIGLPQFAFKNRRNQVFIVNGRVVRVQNMSYYVHEAYSQRLLKGHFPFILLYMDLAYGFTDVNVHPNKLTIRFKDEQKVKYILSEAVNEALFSKPVTGVIQPSSQKAPAENKNKTTEVLENEKTEMIQTADYHAPAKNNLLLAAQQADFFQAVKPTEKKKLNGDDGLFYDVMRALQSKEDDETLKETVEAEEKLELNTPYRILGQLFHSYILIECMDKLLLIDQHAAHERNLYDCAVKAYLKGESLSMQLLIPEVIHVSHAEKVLIDENLPTFAQIGFEMEEFGQLEYKVSAVPYLFNQTDIEGILDDMMGELKSGAKEKPVLRTQNMIKAACKKAVKANQELSQKEIDSIVNAYVQSAAMPTCPHGRPIITAITKNEIEKGFKRIV